MKILVFVKQVPGSAEIRFDPATRTLIREGVKNEINAFDRRALAEAIRYRKEKGGEVIAVSMGPNQAEDVLREALLMGVDSAVHVTDRALAGSDTLVTSRVLAAAARKIGFDLIFCGQYSTDSETGQVPAQLGELLGIPYAPAAMRIEYFGEAMVRITCGTDEGHRILEMPLPAVVSTAERLIKPIKMKDPDLSSASAQHIRRFSLRDLNLSEESVGWSGSPTRVAEIRDVRTTRNPEIWDNLTTAEAAARLVKLAKDRSVTRKVAPAVPTNFSRSDKEYWCWIEFQQQEVRKVSLEILGGAAAIASQAGGHVAAVVAGRPSDRHLLDLLSSFGADGVYHAGSNPLHPDEIVALLCEKISSRRPHAFFFPATSQGKYLAPRIAARLRLGLVGDCVGLELESGGRLSYLKPAFGGNIVAPVFSRTFPQMVTIRPGALDIRQHRESSDISPVKWTLPYNTGHQFTVVAEKSDKGIDASRMDGARFIVGVGAGLGQDGVPLAFQLADLLSGAVGATRRVVDNGWLPGQFQVGLTGKFVAPDVYLALGVSGRYNHMIGLQKSGLIVAVNQEPAAEIFKSVDIGVVGNCIDIAKEMIRILEKS